MNGAVNIYNPATVEISKTTAQVIAYNKECLEEYPVFIDNVDSVVSDDKIKWIRVSGLSDSAFLNKICSHFDIHYLAKDDIINTVQRAKVDEYENSLFIVLKLYHVKDEILAHQVSFFIKNNLIISFEEKESTIFTNFSNLLKSKPLYRNKGEDFLLYHLLDVVIDTYFEIELNLENQINLLDQKIQINPTKDFLIKLIKIRKTIIQKRKSIYPVNDLLNTLLRLDAPYFDKHNKIYIRDLSDHVLRVIDSLDLHRESVNNQIEQYHSLINSKTNEVMKTLTVISSIFIPLTFIVGIYGMNFENMPELKIKEGYFFTLGGMLLISISLMVYFKIKKYY
jgi:magnesium transporter